MLGENGLLSTPAVSALIRRYNKDQEGCCMGAIILTASHNPGGPDNDFGVKFNTENGGPALEGLTNKIFEESKAIKAYPWPKDEISFNAFGILKNNAFGKFGEFEHEFSVEVVDSTANYCELMGSIFDLEAIKNLVSREDFEVTFDGMNGVAGPYARRIFSGILGVDGAKLLNCTPLEDFGGLHPDPNLKYAKQLVDRMGLGSEETKDVPDFGAACDGDADRNMILGKKFFVTPSDSLAVIAANANCIPYFKKNGLKGKFLIHLRRGTQYAYF